NIVWDREAYHTNRYIFPVGFMSKKQYLSAVDVTKRTTYTSEILDGGDTPIVTAADQPGRKFSASSSSGVWKKILDEINCQGVPSKTHASGPEMLGLSHLGITKYIQELPGAEKCTKYVMQRWLDDDQPGKQADLSVKAESTDGDKGSVTNGHDHD
ncbi:2237_t:CDS:2, partial [Paraglomus occultum]